MLTRSQLLELGLSSHSIKHWVSKGVLHPVWRGVYAFGRPGLSRYGRWMAAVLRSGPEAVLSHLDAGALWKIRPDQRGDIHVSVPLAITRRWAGIAIHRRSNLAPRDIAQCRGIPVTSPICTLVDLATMLRRHQLEAAINEADKRDLIDPETLRTALAQYEGRPGVAALRQTLDRRTFALTDSELERRFLPLAREAGLPPPLTGHYVNGFKVDFYWRDIGLIVETDGVRYHRTPSQQARDRLRDQVHAAAGLTTLRFTHAQICFDADHVVATLTAVASRLAS